MAETNIKGIFGLRDFRKRQLAGLVPEKTRESYREYGYVGGGANEPGVSNVDRIDYSNDTSSASIRGHLSVARYSLSASSNNSYAWFTGGRNITKIDRIDYSNDSLTSQPRSSTNLRLGDRSSAGNNNFGYYAGGIISANYTTNYSTIDRLDYSNDLITPVNKGPLTIPRRLLAGVGNNNNSWFIGGMSPSVLLTAIDRIDYSNDTIIALRRSQLQVAFANASGNNNYGWVTGAINHPLGYSSLVRRIDYSNDLVLPIPRGNTNYNFWWHGATGNSNFGYLAGSGQGSSTSRVERIDYSNDTTLTQIRGPLSRSYGATDATSSASFGGSPNSSFASDFTFPTVPNAGYFGGGSDGTNTLATIDKVDYANDTATASVRSALSVARLELAATGNGSFNYFGGGSPTLPTYTSIIDRIEYSSDTQTAIQRSFLTIARRHITATGNSNFGYFGAGYDGPTTYSRVDRIDYSNDSATASVRGPLSLERSDPGATGNSNFGYFGGGSTRTIVDRIDYSNDTSAAIRRGDLNQAKRALNACGNINFGYFGGGGDAGINTLFSSVDRLDYSNDTTITSIRGPLSLSRGFVKATGNSNFGYFSGGSNGPGSFITSITDRINYSNDTAVASIRGPLSTAKSSLAATSPLAYGGAPIYFTNPLPEVLQKQIEFDDSNTLDLPFKRVLGSYGYFTASGNNVVTTTIVNRIDYSNDSVTALVRGSLSVARRWVVGLSNKNFGYISRGQGGVNMDKIDYSNDTANLRILRSLTGEQGGGFSNNFYGYIFANTSLFTRLDFSNDSGSTLQRGSMITSRNTSGCTSTNFFAYISGSISRVDRVNYSNDTANALVRGRLNLVRNNVAATGNSNFGYFGGGYSSISSVERVDYSNDTALASLRGNFNFGRNAHAATGNQSYGWFSSGQLSGSYPSRVERIDFSNDSVLASIRGPLTNASFYGTSITNARSS